MASLRVSKFMEVCHVAPGPFAATPITLARFRKLFSDTIAQGRSFRGRLGDIQTRVATINEAAAMERAGLSPRFEYAIETSTGAASIDLVGLNRVTMEPVRVVQFIRALPRSGNSIVFDPREARAARIIEEGGLGNLLEFIVTGP